VFHPGVDEPPEVADVVLGNVVDGAFHYDVRHLSVSVSDFRPFNHFPAEVHTEFVPLDAPIVTHVVHQLQHLLHEHKCMIDMIEDRQQKLYKVVFTLFGKCLGFLEVAVFISLIECHEFLQIVVLIIITINTLITFLILMIDILNIGGQVIFTISLNLRKNNSFVVSQVYYLYFVGYTLVVEFVVFNSFVNVVNAINLTFGFLGFD